MALGGSGGAGMAPNEGDAVEVDELTIVVAVAAEAEPLRIAISPDLNRATGRGFLGGKRPELVADAGAGITKEHSGPWLDQPP